MQHVSFGTEPGPTTPPPWYDLTAPQTDSPDLDPATGLQKVDKRTKKPKVIKGYLGRPKGMKQVIWERGKWVFGMVGKIAEDDIRGRTDSLSTEAVLMKCTDFSGETKAMEHLVQSRGHLVDFKPTYWPGQLRWAL